MSQTQFDHQEEKEDSKLGSIDWPRTYTVTHSKLVGEVTISGAKNSVLRLMAASLLIPEPVELWNYPDNLLDAQVHLGMLRAVGKRCELSGNRLIITEERSLNSRLEWSGRSIRNTLLILGALTARNGAGAVPLPGGCHLGERQYDLHVMLLEKLGARVWEEKGMLCAETKGDLRGTDIHLPIRSTGATENGIICGVLAQGTTRIWNPHIRPEILDLITFLRSAGAKINVFGQESIEIQGPNNLHSVRHRTIPDNMEALTWLIGSVITGGDVEIRQFPYEHLEIPLIHLRESGARFFRNGDTMIVRGGCCYPVEISTGPYPGINSDMQPIFAVYGACARGQSRIVDLRFPDRYGYVSELLKMGVHCNVRSGALIIQGEGRIKGSRVKAVDLRAGIALTLAGLVASGETVIEDAWQIERGYNNLQAKLKALGAQIIAL